MSFQGAKKLRRRCQCVANLWKSVSIKFCLEFVFSSSDESVSSVSCFALCWGFTLESCTVIFLSLVWPFLDCIGTLYCFPFLICLFSLLTLDCFIAWTSVFLFSSSESESCLFKCGYLGQILANKYWIYNCNGHFFGVWNLAYVLKFLGCLCFNMTFKINFIC